MDKTKADFYKDIDETGAPVKQGGNAYQNLPDKVPLSGKGVKNKVPINKVSNNMIAAHELEQRRGGSVNSAPLPKPKLKDKKPIDINIAVERYSVAWSEDENKVYLNDEIYGQPEVVVDFVGACKKVEKDKKINILKTIVDSLGE